MENRDCEMCGWTHTHCKFCDMEIVDYAQGFICVHCERERSQENTSEND